LKKDVELDQRDMPSIITVGNMEEIPYPWMRVFRVRPSCMKTLKRKEDAS
jgi:hypothetical protein